MGMPKQERVALLLRDALAHPCVIVAGGAILDFLAGRFPRAPRALRRVGLEWLYRLAFEPRRLASRYLLGNAAFLWRIAMIAAIGSRPNSAPGAASADADAIGRDTIQPLAPAIGIVHRGPRTWDVAALLPDLGTSRSRHRNRRPAAGAAALSDAAADVDRPNGAPAVVERHSVRERV
jgi:hypothetical protein